MTSSGCGTPIKEGFLYKWTNYIKGYQKRWFVLSDGSLSYYRNQGEIGKTCRGRICLTSAVIYTDENCNFTISNGANQTFHLRSVNERERQDWVQALELAKAKAIRVQESDEDDDFSLIDQDITGDVQTVIRSISLKLDDLRTCHDLILKHGSVLHRSLGELESLYQTQVHASNGNLDALNMLTRLKTVNERATLFKITSNAMMNACEEFTSIAQTNGKKWAKLLQHEHEQRKKMEQMVEKLMRQRSRHDSSKKKGANSAVSDEDEQFYDAEESATDFSVSVPGKAQRISITGGNRMTNTEENLVESSEEDVVLDDESLASDDLLEKDEYDLSRAAVVVTHKRAGKRRDDSHNGSSSERGSEKDSSLSRSAPGTPNTAPLRPTSNQLRGGDKNLCRSANPSFCDEKTDNGGHGRFKRNYGKDSNPGSHHENESRHTFVSHSPNYCAGGEVISRRERRVRIPERPNHQINLWSIIKNCIGKDLTKIPVPVNFNEPLSMLQRLTEDLEYSQLLDKAARCGPLDATEQILLVAAFAVSSYSATADRLGKPFNPLLGETYEYDRSEDLGWKCISEQVVHHPPILASYCEGRGWKYWREFELHSKFRGKFLEATPLGINHLKFDDGNHYTWNKVSTTVHNIVVGKLWIDHHGEMVISHHSPTGHVCRVKFFKQKAYNFFSKDEDAHRILGEVTDTCGNTVGRLSGTWDDKLEGEFDRDGSIHSFFWHRTLQPKELEKMYNMTVFAVQLNEPEDGVSPTDSRLRPDQRLTEDGNWDEANRVKGVLEDNQRARRRVQEQLYNEAQSRGEDFAIHTPCWFKQEEDPITGKLAHVYKGEYWTCKQKQDWSRCPRIFDL